MPLALLGLAIVLAYLLGLNSFPLTERSEARYFGVAWEMVSSGDYLTPRYNGIKHFHKPPLFYWAEVASMKVFGETEGAGRVPCALAALATMALGTWLAARPGMRCSRPWLVGALLATSPFFWEMGRVAVTDMLVTLLVTGALAMAWRILDQGATWPHLLAFWSLMGLNFLNKGPVGPFLVALVLLPYIVLTRSDWRAFAPVPGIVLAAAIGMPWYLWAVSHNPGLLGYFLKFQTVDRVLTTVHERSGPPWFYLPVILGGFLPWTVWLPGTLRDAWRKAREGQRTAPNPDLFLLLWFIPPTIFFSLIGSKLPPYVLPLFPAIALLMVRHLEGRRLGAPLAMFALAAVACAGQVTMEVAQRLLVFSTQLRAAAVWLVVGLSAGMLASRKKREAALVASMLVTMLGLFTIAVTGLDHLADNSARDLALAIRRDSGGRPYEVAMLGGYFFGLPYYLKQNIVHVDLKRETQFEETDDYKSRVVPDLASYLPRFRLGDKDRYLIVPQSAWGTLSSNLHETVIYSDRRVLVLHYPLTRQENSR